MTIFEWCDKNPTFYLSFTYVVDKVRVSSLSLLTFNEDLSDEDLKDPSFIPFIETVEKNKNVNIQINKRDWPAGYRIYISCNQLKYTRVISEYNVKLSDMLMYTYEVLDNGIGEITDAFLGRDR